MVYNMEVDMCTCVLELININNSKILKFEEHKYLTLSLYQANKNIYTLCIMSNVEYLENLNNLVDMEYAFKGKNHYQAILDIAIEVKYPGGEGYKTLNPYKK